MSNLLLHLIHTFFWLLLSSNISYGSISDFHCLKTLKDSLEDPLNSLSSSWIFGNYSEGFICRFKGVECWHPDENKVLNLRLSGMGLKGEFPKGLENCSSLTGLDLSENQLTGAIPSDISTRIPQITKLDLSSNGFIGEIPVSLSGCQFLNVLKLDNNQITGQIPPQLQSLGRLKTFTVTNNLLSGQIPTFGNSIISADSYANNPSLCGKPLDVCRVKNEMSMDTDAVILGLVVYFVVTVLSSWCWYWLLFAKIKPKISNNQTTTRQTASKGSRATVYFV